MKGNEIRNIDWAITIFVIVVVIIMCCVMITYA